MTSPEIQKDLCRACAGQTSKTIIEDIGDRQFSVLVDEARDASIKEQMAVILRLVCNVWCAIFYLKANHIIINHASYSIWVCQCTRSSD